jgi:tRNA synthetase class II core domain (G, H, P, S and T)
MSTLADETAKWGALEGALRAEGLEYELNPGDGAFYGPKIDLHMLDSIGRSWQLGTMQLDYSMSERFDLAYTGADNAEHRPVMIHRALMGSFERFIGILIEHYAGELPLWLAPVQVVVLPVSDRFNEYGASVQERLQGRVCVSSWTAASRLGARSATPSCGGSRTCSSWVSARWGRARCRCAPVWAPPPGGRQASTAGETPGALRWTSCGSPRRSPSAGILGAWRVGLSERPILAEVTADTAARQTGGHHERQDL